MKIERSVAAGSIAVVAVLWALGGGSAAAEKKPPEVDPLRAQLEGKTAAQRIELLEQRAEAGEASKELHFHLGNAQYEAGNAAAAAAAFEKAVAMDSTFFKAVVNLGLMYDEQQLYPKAIETFEHASRLQPNNPDVWSHMGGTYYSQNDYPKATELYRRALALDPDSPLALYSLAVAFADAGIFREAVKYWEHVVRVDGHSELGKNAAENIDLVKKYLIP